MKNVIYILGLSILLSNFSAFGLNFPNYFSPNNYYYNNAYSRYYNPYSNSYYNSYYNSYNNIYNKNNSSLKNYWRYKKQRFINRLRYDLYNNFLTFNVANKNLAYKAKAKNDDIYDVKDKGKLRGYSVPVDKQIYCDVGFDCDDKKQNQARPTNYTNLFSAPTQTDTYYRSNGQLIRRNNGVGMGTGVRIIYD